jgi:chemotaxis signal transduction protein
VLPNLLDDLLRAWETRPDSPKPIAPADESAAAGDRKQLSVELQAETEQKAAVPEAPEPRVPSFIPPPQTLLPSDPFGSLLATLATQHITAPVETQPEGGSAMNSLLSSLLATFDASATDSGPGPETAAGFEGDPQAESTVPDAVDQPLPQLAPVKGSSFEAPVLRPLPAFTERDERPRVPPSSSAAVSTGRKYVAVAIGTQKFALPIEAVLEVGRRPKVTFVPGLATHVEGVFSFRGEVVPVVNVRALGQNEPPASRVCQEGSTADSPRFVAVQTSNGRSRAALVFDSLEGIVSLDADTSGMPLPNLGLRDAHPLSGSLTGVCSHDSSQFGLISIDRLLEQAGCTEGTAVR